MTLVGYDELKQMGVPYTKTHLNRLANAGEFPKPIKLGPARNSRKAWLKDDIDAWLQQRITIRDTAD